MRPASVLLTLWLVLLGACSDSRDPQGGGIDVIDALGSEAQRGFARALDRRQFSFPEDHNAHRAYRNEWWYLTGHLQGAGGARFGYQVTFFRIALDPQAPPLASDWATSELWMAHVALTDLQRSVHRHAQRFARGALGLAGQRPSTFAVWLEDWRIDGGENGVFPWQLSVATDDFALSLELQPTRAPVLQGDDGLSQKGQTPGNASYYYSMTRLATRGELRSGERVLAVQGQSWLDREWSTSALEDGQAGWDWFSLQLDSGADLMLYQLRRRDGSVDAHSAGTFLAADDRVLRLAQTGFTLRALRYWRSPGGARDPVSWSVQVPEADLDLVVEALLDDQLMETAVTYWEGAVRVRNAQDGVALGQGFLEMTGY